MLRITLWHVPEGFQFYIRDPEMRQSSRQDAVNERLTRGFVVAEGSISVRCLSEFSEVPITVEYMDNSPGTNQFEAWDHVVECPIETKSTRIIFEGTTDPEPFGILEVPPGCYRVRIHFGGQTTGQEDGSTEDFYLVQIWPGSDQRTNILKGEERWPRPKQSWEKSASPD